ncbi:MAG: tyrosine-type recombinase/integrase [Flavobacteriaceae bacterium]
MNDSNNKSVVLKKVEHLLQLKYSGRTPANYLHHIALFLDHAKNVPLRASNEDILDYNLSIRGKGNSYRNIAINAIKAYFSLYLRKEVKQFSSIRPPKQFKQPKVYDAEMLAIKINSILNKKHKAILALGLSGWLRNNEVVNLKIKDIDSIRMKIKINQSKGSKDREVNLSQSTLLILREYVIEFKPVDFLFSGQNSPKYSSVNKVCQNHLGVRFHSLRASGATHAVKSGTDIKTVSEMLGHQKIETTKFYIPKLLENVIQAI